MNPESCESCKFFVPTANAPLMGLDGECRKRSPDPMPGGPALPSDPRGRWPLVLKADWCGEWHGR